MNVLWISTLCISLIKIQSLVRDLWLKQDFHTIAFLPLTFDLVTLTLCHVERSMDINPMYKFDQDRIIGS